MNLRCSHDENLSLEVNHRKMKAGDNLSLWSVNGGKQWPCKFALNKDLTISPRKGNSVSSGVLIGVNPRNSRLQLVKKGDPNRIVWRNWQDPEVMKRIEAKQKAIAEAEEKKRREREAHISSVLNADMVASMKRNGFHKFSGLVPKELVDNALKELNRRLGSVKGGVDKFKAKSFPDHPAITDLFNKSDIPHVVQRLLGMPNMPYQGAGQIAMRFPGDACPGGKVESSQSHLESTSKHWHIDGCPSMFAKGITDHWGEVHNFDALVGVLLSKVEAPQSGELCCFPGSHYELADYFKKKGFKEVYSKGHLPKGAESDKWIKGKPFHGIGVPGDVFIANYMTAHFIAPNASPNIRYAIYFRVKGPYFNKKKKHFPEPMLQPWMNWPMINGSVEVKNTPAAASSQEMKKGEGEMTEKKSSHKVGLEGIQRLATIDYFGVK
eukprot:jgi/Bigna1/75398/fgenesh1_pg.34_\